MSAVLLDGKALSVRMREQLRQKAAALPRQPGLAVILVGDDPASAVYVRNKEKDCTQCGVRCLNHHLPAEATQQELLALVEEMNRREDVDWTAGPCWRPSARRRTWTPSTRRMWVA